MWLDEDKPILKRDLVLEKPFLNTSGALGFTPHPAAGPIFDFLGAFITNPISRNPRQPAANRIYLPFPGGFMLHTGHPNPGITRAVKRYQRRWAGAAQPVIIHVLVESPSMLAEMVRKLEGLENILALELGLPPDCDPGLLSVIMAAGVGELPVIPCLNPGQIPIFLDTLKELKPITVHLVEPRGSMPAPDGGLVTGRLYGPAIFPVMLQAAQTLVNAGLQVIANGGVIARWQVDAFLKAGVIGIGLACAFWQVEQAQLFSLYKP